MRFGDPVDDQHLMLTRKQWENYSSKKNGGEHSGTGLKETQIVSVHLEKAMINQ